MARLPKIRNWLTSEDAKGTYVQKVEAPGNNPLGDAVALASAHAALPAAGGALRLQAGTYACGATGVTFTKPTTLIGEGGRFVSTSQGGTFPGSAITTITFSSRTADALKFTAPGSGLMDLAVVNTNDNTTPPTAGVGVTFTTGYNSAMTRATVAGFYDCVQLAGRFATIDSCHIYDPVNYGLHLTYVAGQTDFGDIGVSNSVIAMYGRTSSAVAACRWDGGGGIRWVNCKIVAGTGPGAAGIGGFQYGLDIMAADGVSTVEFMVVGGGISSCSVACVRIGQTGTGNMNDLTFHGVVFQGSGAAAVAMLVGASSTALLNNIRSVVVSGCTFKGVLAGGIVAYNMRALTIGPNNWSNVAYTGPLITLAGGNDNGGGTVDVHVAKQNLMGNANAVDIVQDNRAAFTNNAPALTGNIDLNYASGVYLPGSTAMTSVFEFDARHYYAGIVDITFTGSVSGVGGLVYQLRRTFTTSNTNTTTTVATPASWTDFSTGPGAASVAIQVVVTGLTVKVQVQTTTAAALEGEIGLRFPANAGVRRFRKAAMA